MKNNKERVFCHNFVKVRPNVAKFSCKLLILLILSYATFGPIDFFSINIPLKVMKNKCFYILFILFIKIYDRKL